MTSSGVRPSGYPSKAQGDHRVVAQYPNGTCAYVGTKHFGLPKAGARLREIDASPLSRGMLERWPKLCELCPLIVSVCPPEFAGQMAGQVARHSSHGVYLDANAISPERTQAIAKRMQEGGARFVDGWIIRPPSNTRKAAYSKGSIALACSVLAAAKELGVLDHSKTAATEKRRFFAL